MRKIGCCLSRGLDPSWTARGRSGHRCSLLILAVDSGISLWSSIHRHRGLSDPAQFPCCRNYRKDCPLFHSPSWPLKEDMVKQ